MSRPVVYFAITSHGFGHAVRAASVAAALQDLDPDILPAMVTVAPHWLLASYLGEDFLYRPRTFDVGVIQADSIQMDKAATLAKWEQIRADSARIVAGEADFIRTNRARLVVADIPPLAAAIARAAGVPCWMLGNFGWDFIYRDWGREFAELADAIAALYNQCDRLFRLPLHEPMAAFPAIADVGLTGGTPRCSRQDLEAIGLASHDRIALLTFGGLGLARLPYRNLARFPDWQFVSFDANAPELPNLLKVEHPLRPVDFLPFVNRVVSKPGYSTFAEAMRQHAPIVTLTREGFAESHLLLDGIRTYARHQIIAPADFFEGEWDFLHRDPDPPRQTQPLPTDGSEAIARAIHDYLHAP